jgi:hypothetical protein
MLGHGLATALPMVGPAAAQVGEKLGTQIGTGDYAGGAGTLGGFAAMYAAPEAAGKIARSKFVTQTVPHGMVANIIKPMAADVKFGKDPAQAILDEGIVANTKEGMATAVDGKLTDVGQQLDRLARASNATVDVSSSLQPLDDAIAKAIKDGDRNLYKRRERNSILTGTRFRCRMAESR